MEIVNIADEDEVYRRLAPHTVDFIRGAAKRSAFMVSNHPDGELSVDLKRLAPPPEEALQRVGRPHFGMGVLQVAEVRALGVRVEHRPVDGNAAHAVILGCTTKTHCDQLAEITTVVIMPKPPG